MSKLIQIFCVITICSRILEASQSVSCSSVEDSYWVQAGYQNTCHVNNVSIRSPEFLISSDYKPEVGGIFYQKNRNIEYLPEKTYEKFPNLIVYDASHCSVKVLVKETFKNLHKLKLFYLGDNEIEVVEEDLFEGLTSLIEINMDNNRIVFFNGDSLNDLPKLKSMMMTENLCIDENCSGSCTISSMQKRLTEKCNNYQYYAKQIKAHNKAKLENKIAEISKLEDLLKICNDQNIEFNNIIDLKSNESSQLLHQLESVNSQLIEKQGKIQRLQEKIEFLSENDS